MKDSLISVIDWFYPPFRRIMPLQTFRYAACGGGNTLLDIIIYFISYKYILRSEVVDVHFYALSRHVAAQLMAFCVSFPTGFFLMRHLVFPGSNLKGRVQLFRYLLLVVACLLLNLSFIKFFVEYCGMYAPVAKIVTTVFVVAFSYFTQKHFTFRVAGEAREEPTA
jgi:putative flippase GtrA